MTHRKPHGHWNQEAKDLAVVHKPEDANSESGYIRISRGNKVHYLHRWVWEQLVGPIPTGMQIDHKNGIRTDCRIDNLRCVKQIANLRNSAIRSDNTSGVKGVSKWAKGNAWRATVYKLDGTMKCKTFSIAKYGDDTAFTMACDARQDMMAELNLQGAGYTARHIT